MKGEYSADDLEVARILVMLPRLVWEADHGPPCTHTLRWGARKRRSAAGDDPQETPHAEGPAAPPPPPCPPPSLRLSPQPLPANEKLGKKRSRATAAEAAPCSDAPASSRKVERPEPDREQPTVAAAAEPPEEAAALGTSSPETPLDFCSSAEEQDAKAKVGHTSDAARPPAKKPKLKHEQLSTQVDELNRSRTELQKEAAEIRNRLAGLKERNSQLMELRIKLEKEGKQQEAEQHLHGRSCLDLLPMGPVRPIAAAHAQQQHYQHAWPQQWGNSHILFHQVAPAFTLHPSTPAAANQQWNWAAASQAWSVDAHTGKVRDLDSSADVGSGLQSRQPLQQQQQHCQHQQQLEQRRSSPEEQRAARKKRIEMIQKRRHAAGAAACGASVKIASFIR